MTSCGILIPVFMWWFFGVVTCLLDKKNQTYALNALHTSVPWPNVVKTTEVGTFLLACLTRWKAEEGQFSTELLQIVHSDVTPSQFDGWFLQIEMWFVTKLVWLPKDFSKLMASTTETFLLQWSSLQKMKMPLISISQSCSWIFDLYFHCYLSRFVNLKLSECNRFRGMWGGSCWISMWSTSGYISRLGGYTISWKSGKQALSYKSWSYSLVSWDTRDSTVWLRHLLQSIITQLRFPFQSILPQNI